MALNFSLPLSVLKCLLLSVITFSESLIKDKLLDQIALVILDALEFRFELICSNCALSSVQSQTERHGEIQFEGQQRQIKSKLEKLVLRDQTFALEGDKENWRNENGQDEEYATD